MIKNKIYEFKDKFRHEVSTALITAFGLVVALAWKDVVTDFIKKVTPANNLLFSAVIITIIALIAIAIISKWSNQEIKK